MRVLVAPDAFKGTLSATEAADCIANGLQSQGIACDRAPIADGGDGTLDVLLSHGFDAHLVDVVDAAGRPRRARIGLRGTEAVIELAEICGLVTVADLPLDAWHRTTTGLGMAAAYAMDAGCTEITLTVGGSASVDGGLGLLSALGFSVLDATGTPVTPDLAGMQHADRVIAPVLAPVRWRVLVDVTTPMAGRDHTAMVFGEQKGLDANERVRGDEILRHWADVLTRSFGVDVRELPGGGAAGGVAAGASAALGAELVSGAHEILALIGVADLMRDCDAVVTGEGAFDAQSLLGKGTGAVIALARTAGIPVYVVTGSCDFDSQALLNAGVAGVITCAELAGDAQLARAEPARWLVAAGTALARVIAAPGGARD